MSFREWVNKYFTRKVIDNLDPDEIIKLLGDKIEDHTDKRLEGAVDSYENRLKARLGKIDSDINSSLDRVLEDPEMRLAIKNRIAKISPVDLSLGNSNQPVLVLSASEFEEKYKNKPGLVGPLSKQPLQISTYDAEHRKNRIFAPLPNSARSIGCNIIVIPDNMFNSYPGYDPFIEINYYFNAGTLLSTAVKQAIESYQE